MMMAPRRYPDRPAPVSDRERAIPFGSVAKMETAATLDRARGQQNPGSRASRLEHRAAVTHLARSRTPRRAAKSP